MLNLLTLPQNLAEEALDGPILGMRKQAREGLVTQPRSFSNERTSWASSHSSIFYTASDPFSLGFILAGSLLDQSSSPFLSQVLTASKVGVGRRLCKQISEAVGFLAVKHSIPLKRSFNTNLQRHLSVRTVILDRTDRENRPTQKLHAEWGKARKSQNLGFQLREDSLLLGR